jgi:hypothetical protein
VTERRTKLHKGTSDDQFLVYLDVPESTISLLAGDPSQVRKGVRVSYNTKTNVLLLKIMALLPQEIAAEGLGDCVTDEIKAMGLRRELISAGH